MNYKVITHNGKAHIDEVMAIALLAQAKDRLPEAIIRIHQDKAEEMVNNRDYDDNSYFIDCGMAFNPNENLYDHHQNRDMPSAALMILEELLPEMIESPIHDYIKLVSLVDTKGPKALDEFSDKSDTLNYFSFTQKLLLRQFENDPLKVIEIIRDYISNQIEFEKLKSGAREWLKENIKIVDLDNLKILQYLNPPPQDLVKAVKSVDGEILDEENIDIIYSFDSENNEVRSLVRTFKADEKIDFTKALADKLKFAHHGGFLIKFIPSDRDEWKKLIKMSLK